MPLEELLEFGSSAEKAEHTANLGGQPLILRLFLGGVHVYFATVWLLMCAACAAVVIAVGHFGNQPVLGGGLLLAFSAVFGFAGLLGGPHSMKELTQRTFLRAGALTILGWLALLIAGH